VLHVLITNDDGILAPGLRAIALQLAARARVTVVAPDSPRSACSHTITLHKPLRLIEHPQFAPDQPNLRAYECSGTPADCVTLALHHVCKGDLPHFVISGINDGPNLGEDLIYSGTVAGAVEGSIQHIPAMAVSLLGDRGASMAVGGSKGPGLDWESAALLVEVLICTLLYRTCMPWHRGFCDQLNLATVPDHWTLQSSTAADAVFPEPGEWMPAELFRVPCFNVNIPDIPRERLQGIRWTRLGHREYEDVVVESNDPKGKPYFWIWGKRITPPQDADADIRAVAEGFVSVTPIQGDLLNLTDLPVFAGHFATGVPGQQS
jgi:5'-nucleotidase